MGHKIEDKQRGAVSYPSLEEMSEIVHDLNVEFYLRTDNEWIYPFELRSSGGASAICFLGHVIWGSEDDMRECLDDDCEAYESLETYLIRESTQLLETISRFLIPKEEEEDEVVDYPSSLPRDQVVLLRCPKCKPSCTNGTYTGMSLEVFKQKKEWRCVKCSSILMEVKKEEE